MICERCGRHTIGFTGSYFDGASICLDRCLPREKAHPQYAEAVRVENEHVRQGNYNFRGIGLPPDLIGGGADDPPDA